MSSRSCRPVPSVLAFLEDVATSERWLHIVRSAYCVSVNRCTSHVAFVNGVPGPALKACLRAVSTAVGPHWDSDIRKPRSNVLRSPANILNIGTRTDGSFVSWYASSKLWTNGNSKIRCLSKLESDSNNPKLFRTLLSWSSALNKPAGS